MKIRIESGVILGLLVAAMGVGVRGDEAGKLAPLPFTVSKETTGIVGPLRGDGTVDYVGALNERYGKGVKAEENGFVAWLGVIGLEEAENAEIKGLQQCMLTMCGAKINGAGWVSYREFLKTTERVDENILDEAEAELGEAAARRWQAVDRPRIADFLRERKAQLDGVGEIVACKKWWMPYVLRDGRTLDSAILWPHRRPYSMTEVCRALCARAMLRLGSGDFDGFARDTENILKLGRLAEGATEMERLVSIHLQRLGWQAVTAAAAGGNLSVEKSKRLAEVMAVAGELPSMAGLVDECVRFIALDRAIVFCTQVQGEPRDTVTSVIGSYEGIEWEAVDWNVLLRRINKHCDAYVQAFKLEGTKEMVSAAEKEAHRAAREFNEVASAVDDWGRLRDETREAYSSRLATVLSYRMTDYVASLERFRREAEMERQMVGVVIAAGRFKSEKGRWPEKLEEMVPEYTKAVPVDIYAEGNATAVQYSWSEEGVVVSSVGTKKSGQQRRIEIGVK